MTLRMALGYVNESSMTRSNWPMAAISSDWNGISWELLKSHIRQGRLQEDCSAGCQLSISYANEAGSFTGYLTARS